jgi:ribosome-binding protein aMBF1 (putative translation factor)
MNLKSISIEGRDYWLVPKDKAKEYPGSVDALAFADKAIGKSLRDARTKAGLTQAELAAKLGKSQSLVARAESGDMVVGEKYMDAALKACRTAKPKKPAPRRATAR